jgi:hypothetical protein
MNIKKTLVITLSTALFFLTGCGLLQEDTSDSGKFDWVASYQIEDIGTFSKILHKRTISNETGIVIAKVPDPETTPETVVEKQLNLVKEGFA